MEDADIGSLLDVLAVTHEDDFVDAEGGGCGALGGVAGHVEHMVWLGRSSAAQLLTRLAAQPHPISHELLDSLPVHQDVHYVRQLLVHTGILTPRLDHLDRLRPWLEQTLADQPASHGRLLRPYLQWDVLHRARRRSQRHGGFTANSGARIRGEVRVVLDLLDHLVRDRLTLDALRQEHVDQWLSAGPAGRYGILRFLAWASDRGLVADVTVPARRPAQPSVFADQDEQVRLCERCLGDHSMPLDVRVAGALILLFGINISRVLAIRADQVSQRNGDTYLTLDRHELIIPPRLAALLAQLPAPRTRSTLPPNPSAPTLLFPGRTPGQPVARAPFGRRLRTYGISARGARNTALITMAADLPAPLLADLLGLHIATAVRWAGYAGRDWESYLAHCRQDVDRHAAGMN